MPGLPIPDEAAFRGTPYDHPGLAWRRAVLRETIAAFQTAAPPDRYHRLAAANRERWREAAMEHAAGPDVRVLPGDWGEVTAALTREFGETFAVLNMANAFVPGGRYVEGTVAQEENMFRRTDCHFSVRAAHLDETGQRYRPDWTALIEGRNGRVHLDTARPRVCIRGPESPGGAPSGYRWLGEDEVFAFYELRAAARDHRDGSPFDEHDARRRIRAQLDTLVAASVRHAVLGASGCGAFENPADRIAAIYREELDARAGAFDCVAFAIYHAGYGPGNFAPFAAAFG